MAQDADDAMSESSRIALAKGKERDWWSIHLEGEMEKLEVVGPWCGTEGGSVDPKRKMGHRSARTNITKEESEEPKGAEMEVDDAVPQEASVEIQCPKRKVIRLESEETQDYVRETLAIEDRSPRRTHIFLSVAPHALACGSRLDGSSFGCVAPLRILRVIHSQHVSSTTL